MEELNRHKRNNCSFIKDCTAEDIIIAVESGFLCKAIRRFFPCNYDDETLVGIYYVNQFLLQDLLQIELKKHIFLHLDRLVEKCKIYLNTDFSDERIKLGIFEYFKSKSIYGLMFAELAWFLSDVNGGGIYDSTPMNEIIDCIEELDIQ